VDRLHVSSEGATSWGAGISPTAHFTVAVPSDSRRPLRTGWAVLDYGRPADAAMMVQATDLRELGALDWPHVPEEGRSETRRSGPIFRPHVLCCDFVRVHHNPLVVTDEDFDSAIAL
jgi:hypothetical protein